MEKVKRYYKLKKNVWTDAVSLDIKRIKERISAYQYVSFDLFDTLIKRDIQIPADIFVFVEQEYNCRYPNEKINGFRDRRILAEKKSRENTKSEEVELIEIYQQMSCYPEQTRERLKALEEETEYKMCTPHLPLLEIFQYCLEQQKKIYITSDMYLPLEQIQRMLQKCNIDGYKKLYLSSRYKKTKRKGTLFDILLKQENIKPEELLHIGDSQYSDDLIPAQKGIATIVIPKGIVYDTRCIPKVKDTLKQNILKCFINNRVAGRGEKNEYYRFGYDSFGVLLWGFCNWLLGELQKNDINKVYFFSRDGWIIKRAFDQVNHEKIASYYLEVSRRSLKVPLLWKDCSLEKVVRELTAESVIRLDNLLEGMGLDITAYKDVISKFGFDQDTFFERKTILNDSKVRQLFELLKTDACSNSEEEYRNICRYLLENDVSGKIAVVDIGWAGRMQRNLISILESMNVPADVSGYYMGVSENAIAQIRERKMKMKGYVFDFVNDAHPIEKRRGFTGLFETLFLEQNGSVMKYGYNSALNRTEAVRYSYEYMEDGEYMQEVFQIRDLQEGAIDFVKDAEKSGIIKEQDLSPSDAFENIRLVCGHPSRKELDMFSDIRFYDEKNISRLARPEYGILHYIFHPGKLKQEIHFSGWKIGFFRNLLGFSVPYYQIGQIKDRLRSRT